MKNRIKNILAAAYNGACTKYWFLAKNLSNCVSLLWILYNPHCHIFSSDLLLLYLIDGSEKKPRSNFLVVFPSGPINFVAFILFFVSCWILWFKCYTGDFFQEHKMKNAILINRISLTTKEWRPCTLVCPYLFDWDLLSWGVNK